MLTDARTSRRTAGVVLAALAAAALQSIAGPAHAQTAPRLVSPGRADQNPVGVGSAVQGRNGPAAPPLAEQRDANAPITPFVLRKVEVQGSSLPPTVLEERYRPFLGATADNPALGRITDAVAAAYPKSDVALYTVLVPKQSFAGGVLRLIVVEGYVQSVRIDGVSDGRLRRLLARYLAPLTRQRPLRTSTFQRAISLVRDVPGLTLTPKLERGAVQGAVRLVLGIKLAHAQVGAGVNNRGTALLGRTQALIDGFADGLLLAGDQLHATYIGPIDDPGLFQYGALAYSAPFNASGGVAQANVGYLRTRPTFVPLKGEAISFGVQASQPLLRSFNRNLYVTASLTGVNSDNALFGFELSNERTRTLRLATAFSQSGAKNFFNISGTVSFGLDGIGASTGDPGYSQTDFKKFNLKVVDNVQVSRNFFLRLDGFAQLTGDLLPPSEQIALGGDEFGRAYEAAIIAGDYGGAGSAELAWRPAKHVPKLFKGSEIYSFVDLGEVWFRGRFGSETIPSKIASTGGGVRAAVLSHTVVQAEAVRGLTNPIFYENREVWRVVFSVRTLF